ncbi:MAG TPA: Tim44/TimA family putative adaptor protein [Alphaproteobacteria bacterium]|nr:Tim44/TimA family putative adaptor protein [Alphaproteobacteria bacterium]
MTNTDWLQIIIFAAIALFFFFRLRSVLGQKTGEEHKHGKLLTQKSLRPVPLRPQDQVPVKDKIDSDQEIAAVLVGQDQVAVKKLQAIYPAFQPTSFLKGAKIAFESVLNAYAEGDTKTLKSLVDQEIFDAFSGSIVERQNKVQQQQTMIVAINDAKIESIKIENSQAFITVLMISEQINVIRNQDGQVIEGDATAVRNIRDLWTFRKDLRNMDPNWLLVATHNAED